MKRPLFWIGFLYFLGLAAGAFMPFALRMGVAAILVAAILVLLILRRYHAIPVRTLAICLLFAAGLGVFSLNDAHFLKTKSIADGKTVTVVGTIEEVEREQEKRIYRIRASSVQLSDGTRVPGSSTLRLSTTKPLDADLFDTVSFRAKLFLPKEGYHFDTLQYYRSIGIDYVGYPLMDDPTFRVLKNGEDGFISRLRLGVYHMRKALGNAIDRETDDHEGVLKAMLVGDTASLDENTRQDFIQSGMSHMLVVSGMHFSIITTMLLMLLRMLKVKRRLRYGIVMAFCVFLMVLWSFTPSVVRAGIMMLMYCLSNIVRRQNDSLSSLGLALLIICLANPFSANNLSLQFSAMSTIGVIVLSPVLYRKLVGARHAGRVATIALNAFSMSISATIFTLPVVLAQTGMLSFIGPLANTLAAFLLTPILLLGFVAMLFGVLPVFSFIGAVVMILPRFFAFVLIKLAGICASVPYASIYIKTLPGVITILAVAFLWAFSYLLLKRVHVKLMVSLSLLIVLVSLLAYSLFYYNAVEVSVIQEDASTSVVICHNRQTVVCTDAKESYLLRQLLKEKGVRQIDALVVLNARESAVKTLSALVNAYPVKAVWAQSSLLQDLKTACPDAIGQYNPLVTSALSVGRAQMVLYQDDDFYALGLYAGGKRLLSLWEDYDITKVGTWYTNADMVFLPYLPQEAQMRQTSATLVRLNTTGLYYTPPQGAKVLDFYRVFTLLL